MDRGHYCCGYSPWPRSHCAEDILREFNPNFLNIGLDLLWEHASSMGIDHLCVGCCAPAGSAGQASTLQYSLHLRRAVSHLMHLHSNLHDSMLASETNLWHCFGLQASTRTCLLDVVPVCLTNPQQDVELCALSINLQSRISRHEAIRLVACITMQACGGAYLQQIDVMESLLLHHMTQRLHLAVKQLGTLKPGCFHAVSLQLLLLQRMSCGVAWHCRVESELLLAACLSAKSQREHCDLHSTQQPEGKCAVYHMCATSP